jgi:TolB-like protein
VARSLAKDPGDRPTSARDIIRVLDTASTPSAISVAPANATAHGVSRRTSALTAAIIVLALGAGATMFARSRSGAPSANTSTDRSIAVLPFENATRDTAQEYFADGLTEELIGRLATIGMRVTGRNSVFTYKGQHPTARAIGSSLRVGSVMTGSVRRAGEQLHVSAELASTSNDSVIWSFSVDRPATQILALQKELVDSLANRFRLADNVERRRTTAGTTNLAARDAYMRGQYLSYKLTQKDLSAAIEEYDEAIRLDPHYALPHVGKAAALGWLADGFVAPRTVLGPVRAEIAMAKATDSTVAEVWTMAAVAEVAWGWDWPAARRYIDRAIALNGGDANTWFAEMGYQIAQGDIDAAMKASDEAFRLDPLSPGIVANRFFLPLLAGRVDEAQKRSRDIPAGMMDVLNYGDAIPVLLLELTGHGQAAESLYVAAEKTMGHRSPSLGVFYLKTGRPDSARRVLADIERTWPAKYIPPELVARLPAALGDTATMYKWLERGVAARSAWAVYLASMELELAPHRGEPHFKAILARTGLKDAGTSVR